MAYSDFTLKEVTHRFQLHMEEKPDVFSEVPEGEVSALLQRAKNENLKGALRGCWRYTKY